MSENQAEIQEFEKAAAVILSEVYMPAFIKRCSELGITFNDEDDLVAALENVATLKAAEESLPEAQSLHKQANLALKNLINNGNDNSDEDFKRFLSELA